MNGKIDRISVRFYPMNQKSDWDWIRSSPDVAVRRAYAFAPYTGDLKNGDFFVHSTTGVAVCGAYAIRPYTEGRKFIGVLVRFYPMNQKSDRNWIHPASGVAVCRAYAIRHYPTGRKFIGVSVRFYPGNEIIVIFSGTRVGAYCIRPTNGHANGQMNEKMDVVSVRFYPMNQKSDRDWIYSATSVVVCGAYAIRPYTNDLKKDDFSIRSTSGVAVCGAYAIHPYTAGRKFIGVLVRFYPGKGKMAEDSMDSHPRKGVWGCSIVVVRFLDHMPGFHFEVTVDYIDG